MQANRVRPAVLAGRFLIPMSPHRGLNFDNLSNLGIW
jgi:hypothetical protein